MLTAEPPAKLFAFGLSFAALILQGVLAPPMTLLAFAPWIALLSLSSSLEKTLWLSALAGGCVDLLSEDPLGIHALNYCLSAALLFRFRKPFSQENPLHFSLFSSLVSLVSTLIQMFLLFLFDRRIPFAGKWLLGDLIGMPLIDGLYAWIWIFLPSMLYHKLRRHGSVYWRIIRQKVFPTSP